MNTRGLLVALVLAAILGGGIWWSLQDEKAKVGKPAADAAPKILEIPEGQFKRIEIGRLGATEILRLERLNGGSTWTITAPQAYRADAGEVGSLVTTLSSLVSERLIEEKAPDLSQYGLHEPALTVTMTLQDGKTRKLLVGDNSPMSGGYFAKTEGDARVFSIASFNYTALTKTVNDLRDKRLLSFDTDKLVRVELTAGGASYELGKNALKEWSILKPKLMRAEGGRVEEILTKVREIRMDPGVSEADAKAAEASFAAGAPVLVARATDSSGAQTIEIRKNKDDYFAKSSAMAGAHKVAADAGQSLGKGLDGIRNKKLFDFGFADVNRLEVKLDGKTVAYEKKGEDWFAGGKKMDNIAIQGLIDKLRELAAVKFPESGFTSAEAEAAVSSTDGEGKKREERVLLAKTPGGAWIAQRAGEPSLYELEAKTMDEFKQFAAAIKDAKPEAPAKSGAPAKK